MSRAERGQKKTGEGKAGSEGTTGAPSKGTGTMRTPQVGGHGPVMTGGKKKESRLSFL